MQAYFFIAISILCLIGAGVILGLVVTIVRIGSDRWKEAAQLSGTAHKVLVGEVETDRDGLRDPRVAKGKVWKKATKSWSPQGKLADEYIKNLVR